MSRKKLEAAAVDAFSRSASWGAQGDALEKVFEFAAYRDGVAFAVAVAMAADKLDHHPDLAIGYGKVTVRWTTHDAGGITGLDRDMAVLCDELASRHGGSSKAP